MHHTTITCEQASSKASSVPGGKSFIQRVLLTAVRTVIGGLAGVATLGFLLLVIGKYVEYINMVLLASSAGFVACSYGIAKQLQQEEDERPLVGSKTSPFVKFFPVVVIALGAIALNVNATTTAYQHQEESCRLEVVYANTPTEQCSRFYRNQDPIKLIKSKLQNQQQDLKAPVITNSWELLS